MTSSSYHLGPRHPLDERSSNPESLQFFAKLDTARTPISLMEAVNELLTAIPPTNFVPPPSFLEREQDSRPKLRRAVARVIGFATPCTQSIGALERLRHDIDPAVRLTAVGASARAGVVDGPIRELYNRKYTEGIVLGISAPRLVEAPEIAEMFLLHHRAFADYQNHALLDQWGITEFARYCLDSSRFTPGIAITAREKETGKMRGFALFQDAQPEQHLNTVHLCNIAVDPEVQPQGIARQLLEASEDFFAALGYQYLLRKCLHERGWAERVRASAERRQVLVQCSTIHSQFGTHWAMITHLPQRAE